MADLSLYLTNVHVSIGQNMHVDQTLSAGKDFECVELGGLEPPEEKEEEEEERQQEPDGERREKPPRRVIHFSSGETMEEYSTDEEAGEEPEKKDLLATAAAQLEAARAQMTWGPYFWFHMWRAATSTISACDYVGERMASLFGITTAKYQYAIDEYNRIRKEKEEENEENRLSEVAEQSFAGSQTQKGGVEEQIAMPDQPDD